MYSSASQKMNSYPQPSTSRPQPETPSSRSILQSPKCTDQPKKSREEEVREARGECLPVVICGELLVVVLSNMAVARGSTEHPLRVPKDQRGFQGGGARIEGCSVFDDSTAVKVGLIFEMAVVTTPGASQTMVDSFEEVGSSRLDKLPDLWRCGYWEAVVNTVIAVGRRSPFWWRGSSYYGYDGSRLLSEIETMLVMRMAKLWCGVDSPVTITADSGDPVVVRGGTLPEQ